MKTSIKFKTTILPVLILVVLACFELLPRAEAVMPAPDEGSKPAMERTTAGLLLTPPLYQNVRLTVRRLRTRSQMLKDREALKVRNVLLPFIFSNLQTITQNTKCTANVHKVHHSPDGLSRSGNLCLLHATRAWDFGIRPT